jgi:DNA alkylation repair enzyme
MTLDPNDIAAEIERELRAAGTPERAVAEQRYLKSDLEFLGTSVGANRRVITAFRR